MMETQTKTPVETVQELIAIHTTRKEAGDKLKEKQIELQAVSAIPQQSDEFISELMAELSTFGDAVQGEVSRENEYQEIWKNAFVRIDNMDKSELAQTFHSMEGSLKNIYQTILDTKPELPDSLREIITKQGNQL